MSQMKEKRSDETAPIVRPKPNYIRFFIVMPIVLGLGFGLTYLAAKQPDIGDMIAFNSYSTILAKTLFATALLSYGLNLIVFIPAGIYETEKFFDLTGSITYILCSIVSLAIGSDGFKSEYLHPRQILLTCFVIIWALRLGSFLYARIHSAKKDGRFDEIKINFLRFMAVWTIQGLWVLLTALPVYTANGMSTTSNAAKDFGAQDAIGVFTWVVGFAIEVIADRQKGAFAADPSNKGKWIDVGLWRYSRHPNYFGEMTLWTGNFITAATLFEDSQWATVISPLFVVFLLMKVSGVPALEKRADEKWGGIKEYESYKQAVSIIIPMPRKEVDANLQTDNLVRNGSGPADAI
jgi:steroid 5-alpha reductase family enzyme